MEVRKQRKHDLIDAGGRHEVRGSRTTLDRRMPPYQNYSSQPWCLGLDFRLAGVESRSGRSSPMRLTRVGTCEGGTCPTVYATDRGTFVVQGAIVDDPEALADVSVPAHETLVEVPADLLLNLKAGS